MGANDTIIAGRPSTVGAGQPEADAGPPGLQVVKLTDVGRVRTHNEDFVDYHAPEDPAQREQKGMLCLVADGMGGHQAGEVASRESVQFVIGQYFGDTAHDIGTSLVRAFRAANRLVQEQALVDTAKAGMGTTLVGAVILGRQVFIANVGDSRAYIIGKGGTNQITEDHSWVEEQVRAGLITPDQARVHPQRNLVTRALGSKPSVEVDLFQGRIEDGDSLLLCSDGLTNHVRDPEIEVIVQQNPPQEAARLLIELAKERGGTDNITVLLVSARKPREAEAAAPSAPSRRGIPLLPILAGAAVVLALVAVAVYFLVIRPKGDATPVPSATVLLAPSSTLPVGIPSALPSESPVATATAEASPTAVDTLPAAEGTAAPATSTLAPTSTPAQPATLAPTDTVPAGRSTSTPSPTYGPPTLTSPQANQTLRGPTTFQWTYSADLKQLESFQVLVWRDGEPGPHEGAALFWKEPGPSAFRQTIDLDAVTATANGPGLYRWTVVVVNTETRQRLSVETAGRPFDYPGRPATVPVLPDPCVSFDCDKYCKTNLCLRPLLCNQCCGGCHH